MNTKTEQAIFNLMPLGGYSIAGDVITVHEDGAAYGYTVPTEAEIASEIVNIEAAPESQEWFKNRTGAEGYVTAEEQMAMRYDDEVNGTSTWRQHVMDVKTRFPKT